MESATCKPASAESDILGATKEATVEPDTTKSKPSTEFATTETFRPATPNRNLSKVCAEGFDFTSKDCSNPVASKRTNKSTPGNTSTNLATLPSNKGFGKAPSQPKPKT
ncbi:MAG: hypothetical protein ORN27_10230 [Rhodoluna sp.]|nr:hypothetical protein [Rhodoluna sp.]